MSGFEPIDTGRWIRDARGTRMTTTVAEPTAGVVTAASLEKMRRLSFWGLLAAFQKSCRSFGAFGTPATCQELSRSSTPRTMTPPSEFAIAETVGQIDSGSPPLAALNSQSAFSPASTASRMSSGHIDSTPARP